MIRMLYGDLDRRLTDHSAPGGIQQTNVKVLVIFRQRVVVKCDVDDGEVLTGKKRKTATTMLRELKKNQIIDSYLQQNE